MEYLSWIVEKGSQIDIVWVAGFAVVGMGKYFISRQDKINALDRDDKRLMWSEIKEVTRLYHQVDKLEALNSLAIRCLSGGVIETVKQSADGKGDHAINRDV